MEIVMKAVYKNNTFTNNVAFSASYKVVKHKINTVDGKKVPVNRANCRLMPAHKKHSRTAVRAAG